MRLFRTLAVVALGTIAMQPASAADDLRFGDRPAHQSAAFAGASVDIPFGIGGRLRRPPTADLQLGIDHVYEHCSSAVLPSRHRSGAIELRFAKRNRPTLLVAGAPASDLHRRLGISTAGAVAIGVGVALVAVVAVAAASGPSDDILP